MLPFFIALAVASLAFWRVALKVMVIVAIFLIVSGVVLIIQDLHHLSRTACRSAPRKNRRPAAWRDARRRLPTAAQRLTRRGACQPYPAPPGVLLLSLGQVRGIYIEPGTVCVDARGRRCTQGSWQGAAA